MLASRWGALHPPSQSKSHRLPSRPDSIMLAHRTHHAILSQSGAGPTVPGPLQYHMTLAYHHDKKTPIHVLIAALTTRAYYYARGTSDAGLTLHHSTITPRKSRPPT